MQLGRVLAKEGKSDEAAQTAEGSRAGASDPHAALELGTLYVKAGKYAEAEQQFRIAVKACRRMPRPISRWARC